MNRMPRPTAMLRFAKLSRKLLASLPPDFVFSAAGPVVGHHGVGRLNWRSGRPDSPAAVTGTDVAHVAHIEGGRISSLYVFLNPASR